MWGSIALTKGKKISLPLLCQLRVTQLCFALKATDRSHRTQRSLTIDPLSRTQLPTVVGPHRATKHWDCLACLATV